MANTSGENWLPGVVLATDEDSGVTELMLAAFRGQVNRVHELLLEDCSQLQAKNQLGASVLDYAVSNKQVKVVDALIGHGQDIDTLDVDGYNILHRSVLSGQYDLVQICVELGSNIDYHCTGGDTALILAVKNGKVNIVTYLIDVMCNITITSSEGFSALEYAFFTDNKDLQSYLQKVPEQICFCPSKVGRQFFRASKVGDVHAMEILIAEWTDAIVNFSDPNGGSVTPFLIACNRGHLPAVKLLHQHGACIHQRDKKGNTALIVAVKSNQLHIVEWLIENGALINYSHPVNGTALHYATMNGKSRTVRHLVEAGALLNISCPYHVGGIGSVSLAPLHMAVMCRKWKIIQSLLKSGAYVDKMCIIGAPLGIAAQNADRKSMKYLLKYSANINKEQYGGRTALMMAVIKDKLKVVKLLVKNKADINRINKEDEMALDLAISLNRSEIASYLIQSGYINSTSIPEGSAMAAQSTTILTHIHQCILQGNSDILKILLECGVQKCLPAVLLDACLSSNINIVKMIVEHLKHANIKGGSDYVELALEFAIANDQREAVAYFMTEMCEHSDVMTEVLLTACPLSPINHNTMFTTLKSQGMKAVLELALECGRYEVAKLLTGHQSREIGLNELTLSQFYTGGNDHVQSADGSIKVKHPDFCTRISQMSDVINCAWKDLLDTIHSAIIMKVIGYPCMAVVGISRSRDRSTVYVYARPENCDTARQYMKQIMRTIPHQELVTVEVIAQTHEPKPLSGDLQHLHTSRAGYIHLSRFIGVQCGQLEFCDPAGCFIKDSTGQTWVLTTGTNIKAFLSAPASAASIQGRKNVSLYCDKLSECKAWLCHLYIDLDGVTSVDIAAFCLEGADIICEPCFRNPLIYCGENESLLGRKIGFGSGPTEGIIMDVDVSFKDEHGHFYHGAFVVSPLREEHVLAEYEVEYGAEYGVAYGAEYGAVVVERDSGMLLGLVVAEQHQYVAPIEQSQHEKICFCLPIYHSLRALYAKWELQLGRFRTF